MGEIQDSGDATYSVGDHILVHSGFRWDALKVLEVKKATLKARNIGPWPHTRTINKDRVRFAGAEEAVSALLNLLVSSDALCDEECCKSRDRRAARNANLIAKASLTSRNTSQGAS